MSILFEKIFQCTLLADSISDSKESWTCENSAELKLHLHFNIQKQRSK